MSPMQFEPKIPDRMTLERRHVCAPRVDELPTLRDEQGRVLAVVEGWRPELAN